MKATPALIPDSDAGTHLQIRALFAAIALRSLMSSITIALMNQAIHMHTRSRPKPSLWTRGARRRIGSVIRAAGHADKCLFQNALQSKAMLLLPCLGSKYRRNLNSTNRF